MGAPSFAHVAKGGYRTADSEWFYSKYSNERLEPTPSAASYPPLHKAQGRGTHSDDGVVKQKGWATMPNGARWSARGRS